ncbi:aldo/keto reductase [Sphingomonas sp. PR090111-T3T-6A]|uniref:aldo/keto reductase n=1 Tax=Sphingomonas sp. PR090111-T3T-6A TaxID=685778 RepID=UPI000365A924|nr:aldo/keto reductase [Sphingomonas sp. PR090111-T3T-6A]
MRYRSFGRGTGLRCSEIALGGALFGTAWGYGAPRDEVFRMLDAYGAAGGNFIDTSDSYQFGESETILGEYLARDRDAFVVASKYTLGARMAGTPLSTGNSRRAMVLSVEESLRRLRTDRIDLYWVHMPDGETASEEIMRGLDDLAGAGKILYAGFSDFPAWRVARAATMAELRGWTPLIGIQIEYSLVERSADRELLPMADALGLGVASWSPLGGGLLTGKYRRGEEGRATGFGRVVHRESDAIKTATMDALIDVATELGVSPSQVALAWQIGRGITPIVGPRTTEQLHDNLGAAGVSLSDAQLRRLDAASAIPLGFPHDFLADDAQRLSVKSGDDEWIVPPDRPVA